MAAEIFIQQLLGLIVHLRAHHSIRTLCTFRADKRLGEIGIAGEATHNRRNEVACR